MPPPDDRPPDPQAAWQKAATIGAPGIGSRYLTPLNPTTWNLIKAFLGGERPQTVAAQDPYGIKAWEAGKGPPPMLFGTTEPVEAPGIRAYHGSPHEFEKFSLSKIGTGEGAQAYGHGLYFAEKEATAKAYREQLSGLLPSGWSDKYPESARAYIRGVTGDVASGKLTPEQAAKHVYNANAPMRGYPQEKLAAEIAEGAKLTKGKMYEVNIGAHFDDFLDWDKPLKEQPANVKAAANDLFRGRLQTREVGPDLVDVHEKGGGSLGVFPKDKVADVLANPADYYPYRGKEFYQLLESERAVDRGAWTNPSEYASQELAQIHGIPGIKYLDQGSRMTGTVTKLGDNWFMKGSSTPYPTRDAAERAARAAGQASHNFVVFDDKLISILRKYGLLPPIAAGTLGLSQLARPAQPEAR